MAISYNWAISQLECYPLHEGFANVVFTVHWRRHAVDGSYVAEAYGSQSLTLDPNAAYIPYDQLTQSDVEGWLVSSMGQDRVDEIDASLLAQINALKNPPVVTPPLPWN